ncbi:MAG: hypothetical protein ABIZ05_01770 [Pseudonocardiaceae bacterium]
MYELSRARLHSVGPKGARYQDVTLDLRHVGAPVAKPPQHALFDLEPDTPARDRGSPRRPSPATVLFLENGGGKSVLLKLIFSVMLPGRRQVVGTSNTRVLEKFVLGTDVAHVVLEWQHVGTGERVIVGKVSAWRDHVVSTDPNRLLEAWYSFRPTTAFNLDTLPFTELGRVVSMAGFRDRFTDARAAEPELQAVWEPIHGLWTAHLGNLGLDPELLNYQRRMNAGEGEAASAFTFKSDEAFIDWLLTAVTGEDSPRSLGEVVEQYATKLAQRDGLMAERDFVAGALERLTPLAAAARDATAAAALNRETHGTVARFAAVLTTRHAHETERLTRLATDAKQAADAEREADRQVGRLNRILNELRRALAGLRWRAAEQQMERLRDQRDDARATLAGWQATDTVLAHARAREEAERFRAIIGQREQKAAPVLAAREQAAKRLARGLLAVAASADAEVTRLEASAAETDDQVAQAERGGDEATRRAEQERGRAAGAEAAIAAAQSALRAAVTDGLLLSATDDVAVAAERARGIAAAATEQVAAALGELVALSAERKNTGAGLRAAQATRHDKQTATGDAERALTTAQRIAEALVAEDRLTGLLGTDTVLLDTDTPTLLDLLDTAIHTAEGEQTTQRIAQRHDQRVLDALGTGGLLPPSDDVSASLASLEDADITAWSGWRYLASIPADERAQILARHPHLVDGIALNNPDHLDRAERILTAARLLPRCVVAVGTTAALTDRDAPVPAGIGFLVPPNPAMYDEDKAEDERQSLLATQERRRTRLAALTAEIAADQRLVVRLRDWARDYPPGTLRRLAEEHTTAAHALRLAQQTVDELAARIEEIENAEHTLQETLPERRHAETEAKGRAERLTRLAERTAPIPDWQRSIREARDAATSHEHDAERHRVRAGRLREAAATARRTADDHRRIAVTSRDELRKVAGGGAVEASSPVPAEPVETLRAAYDTAQTAYAKVEVGADLRSELAGVEAREADTRSNVEAVAPDIRALASQLLTSLDGADAAARAAATERAARTAQHCEDDYTAQATEVGELKRDYERLAPQEVVLELPYERPSDIPQAERLVARAQAEWETARRGCEDLTTRRERLDAEVNGTERIVTGFQAHLDVLGSVITDRLEVDPGLAAYTGNVEEARARRVDLMGQLREADEVLHDAERLVRRTVDALASYATADRFEQVDSLVRRQISSVDREALPNYAAEWETALRSRFRSLADDLGQINRHRGAIITRLRGMVEQSLGTLRAAQRLSKLPDGLGDWSGQEFLRIKFADADPAVLDERLGEVIDEATAASGTRAGDNRRLSRQSDHSGGKRDGLTLLLRGVRAVMPKGVKVEMLKPDAVLRTERVRVAEVSDVFSGGQLLTAAIILYCTMAALRANERGHARRTHAGVLFLDNPIGRASAGYLLELQLSVADRLGVQLIYTTGLFDTNALSVFPLLIRLRNDADLRAGLKYLSVEASISDTLAQLPEADDTGVLTSARVFTRPPDTSAGRPA